MPIQMCHLRQSDFRRMPWKNGQGVTIELAIGPRPEGEGFDWRISTATVAAAGPFSTFEGIDRTLAIIRGGKLDLVVEGQPDVTLDIASAPYAFAGEWAVVCTPHLTCTDRPIDDFNVMTRRGQWVQQLTRMTVSPAGDVCSLQGDVMFFYNAGSTLTVILSHDDLTTEYALAAGEALQCTEIGDGVASVRAASSDDVADLFVVTLAQV